MAFEFHLIGSYHLELILILKKKRMHFRQYQRMVMNLQMQFNESIRNFPASYHLLFGINRCSCGFAYDQL